MFGVPARKPEPVSPPEDTPVWEKMECDKGCRWTQVKGSFATQEDGSPCVFSGCEPGHVVHKRGLTTDVFEAHNWFKNVYEVHAAD